MLKLMIECSRTGRQISTGIETDTRSFLALKKFQANTFCPYCQRYHLWSKNDVCVDTSDSELWRH
jgi:hypothetical protein